LIDYMNKKIDRNPYHLCTLDPSSACDTCENNNVIDCKLNRKQTLLTTLVIYSFIAVSVTGLFLVGTITQQWWILAVFVVFVALFFLIIEPRITCSHCPYYAEKRMRFNCPGNMLTPKLWRYHPEPMNGYEQLATLAGFIFFGAFPIFSELYGLWFLATEGVPIMDVRMLDLGLLLFATIILISVLFTMFLFVFCPKCVNFSCQFNRVPKTVADKYLKKNPVLKEAWEKSGYKF
jgi:hypothetical protein